MYFVSVISKNGKPLMPTKPSRARRWLEEGKAVIYKNGDCSSVFGESKILPGYSRSKGDD